MCRFTTRLGGSLLLLGTLLLSGCNVDNADYKPASDVPVTLSDTTKARGFALDGDNVVFIFDTIQQTDMLDAAKVTQVDKVDLRGSFNGWTATNGFEMTKSLTDEGVWYLSLPKSLIAIPGNSGQSEFKFVVNGTVNGTAATEAWLSVSATAPTAYTFGGNHLVLFASADEQIILTNQLVADKVKSLSDFDLTTTAGKQQIANFRLVPGTSQLYRSYHPFKKSRSQYETEDTRVAMVQTLMQQHGVGTVITLYKDETGSLDSSKNETISSYHQTLIAGGHNLYLPDADYNTVYYSSNGSKFAGWIKQVVEFILLDSNLTPVEIHCRLGTDRTGVFSAVLAALNGATWKQIAADYQLSNEMGIKEFRDYRLLQYSLENMLKVDLDSADVNLQSEMVNYFISNGYLTQAQIDALQVKLNKANPT